MAPNQIRQYEMLLRQRLLEDLSLFISIIWTKNKNMNQLSWSLTTYEALEIKNEFRVLMCKPEEKRPYSKPRAKWNDIESCGN
jgi:hypothetical protein